MDATTIDQEFEQLQAEFQDVAKTVQGLAAKMQAATQAGDANGAEWLADLKHIAQDIDDEQAQVKALLLAIHGFIGGVAEKQQAAAAAEEKPPLFAPGQEPAEEEGTQQSGQQHHGMLGGMLGGMGGGMMGGGMFGGYSGGGFGRAMEMGMAMNLGANLVSTIFR
jgi:hypothetical protein